MDNELYLLGVDKGEKTCDKTTVVLLKIGYSGVLQLLDYFTLSAGFTPVELENQIDRMVLIYQDMYRMELERNDTGTGNKWYSKKVGEKIKVNNTLLEQLKNFKWK